MYLHRRRVVHKDIKPENIMIREKGKRLETAVVIVARRNRATRGREEECEQNRTGGEGGGRGKSEDREEGNGWRSRRKRRMEERGEGREEDGRKKMERRERKEQDEKEGREQDEKAKEHSSECTHSISSSEDRSFVTHSSWEELMEAMEKEADARKEEEDEWREEEGVSLRWGDMGDDDFLWEGATLVDEVEREEMEKEGKREEIKCATGTAQQTPEEAGPQRSRTGEERQEERRTEEVGEKEVASRRHSGGASEEEEEAGGESSFARKEFVDRIYQSLNRREMKIREGIREHWVAVPEQCLEERKNDGEGEQRRDEEEVVGGSRSEEQGLEVRIIDFGTAYVMEENNLIWDSGRMGSSFTL